MSESHEPASPQEDLARYRRAAIPPGEVLTPELAEFIQSGVGISIATRSADGRPLPGFAHGARIVGRRVRLVLDGSIYHGVIAAVEAGSPIAATFSRALDHRSIQLKGHAPRLREADREDVARATVQAASFRDELITVNYEPAWAGLYMAFDRGRCRVIEFEPYAAFVQTPGPGAGTELSR